MNFDKSSIERLKKRLYAKETLPPRERRHLRELSYEVGEDWQSDAPQSERADHSRLLTYLLIGSGAFFIVSLIVSTFLIVGSSPISPKKVRIEVQGPATVSGGEELTLQILITNDNSAAIESANLSVEYPEGARLPTDLKTELPREHFSLGTLAAGESVQKTVHVSLFGEENSEQVIKMAVEYRIKSSNAIFSAEQTYPVLLSSAPVALRVESVKEITSGQSVELEVTVASNSATPVKDVLLAAEYPFGFTFERSAPSPTYRNSVWELGDLKPEEKRTVRITGKLVGESEEERVFRISAGLRSVRNSTELGTAFMTAENIITITKPFIGVSLAINGSGTSEPSVRRDDPVRADITWYNNLSSKVTDAELSVVLNGAVIDKRSVSVSNGFYSSSNNTILWNGETYPDFRSIDAGESGTVSFSLDLLGADALGALRDPKIDLSIHIKGRRLSEDNVPETIESSLSRTIRVASALGLSSQVLYSSGPFKNQGPLPPQVDRETTYTILWTVTNTSNSATDISVTASVPSYVRFGSKVEPASADVRFSDVGGNIVWNIGMLPPQGRKDVAFQIVFKPSLSQVGTSPTLVGEQTVRGTDAFTGAALSASRPALTTGLYGDPQFISGQERVVE